MSHKISLLIVEPSEIIACGVMQSLADHSHYNILAPMSDAQNLAERILASKPDVLLINPTLLQSPVQAQLLQLQQQHPSMAIVALVYQYMDPNVLMPFRATLDISIRKNQVAAVLQDAYMAAKEEYTENDESYELSDREIEVLVLVAGGMSSKEIADKLHISVHTVSTHRKNITHKTGIKSVAGLVMYAMIHNLTLST